MSLLWTIVILVVANAVTIAAMLLVRRGAPEGSYFKDGDRASGVFGVLAGGFAIFAGFIIFLAFTTYDQSRSGGEAEALTVVQQFETARVPPGGGAAPAWAGSSSATDARSSTRSGRRWRTGRAATRSTRGRSRCSGACSSRTRRTPAEQAAYGKWLDQTSDREEGRRDRLHGAEGIIPTSIWLVLFLIAGVVFAFMLFFADSGEGARSQAMLMGSATTVIVLTLLAINALNNPYRHGLGQIKPVAMERSLRLLDSARAVAERDGAASVRRPRRSGRVLMDDAGQDRFERHFELAATVLLAMAAVATAWAAYQSARWHGKQAKAQSASIAARVESTRAANVANRQAQIDVALFTQWVDAYARDETELDGFYRKRFRPEFRPAFEAWVATKPRKNPDAPLSPFAMPQYKLAATAKADRSRRRPPRSPQRVGTLIQRADNYSLAVVLFAASLFFAGISTRLHSPNAADGRARARLRAVPRHRDLDRDVPGQRLGLATGLSIRSPVLTRLRSSSCRPPFCRERLARLRRCRRRACWPACGRASA